MQVKQLVTTRMAGKKGASKGMGKGSMPGPSSSDGWKTSKCCEADLQSLVDQFLLQPKEIIMWHVAIDNARPFENAEEIVLF
jgi:hypothetical protein